MAEMIPEAALAAEALDYFEKAGDAGDRVYVAALRTHLQTLQARSEALQADAERLDWLDSRGFTAYRTLDPEHGLMKHVTVCDEHERPRRGHVAPTLRAAIDSARKETKG